MSSRDAKCDDYAVGRLARGAQKCRTDDDHEYDEHERDPFVRDIKDDFASPCLLGHFEYIWTHFQEASTEHGLVNNEFRDQARGSSLSSRNTLYVSPGGSSAALSFHIDSTQGKSATR